MTFQSMQGYGVPNQGQVTDKERQMWEVAAGLAGMPDSNLTQGLFNTQQPTGDMVGRVYVGADPLQNLNSSLRQGMGGYMVKNRADQAKNMIEALRKNQAPDAMAQPKNDPWSGY